MKKFIYFGISIGLLTVLSSYTFDLSLIATSKIELTKKANQIAYDLFDLKSEEDIIKEVSLPYRINFIKDEYQQFHSFEISVNIKLISFGMNKVFSLIRHY